MTSLTSTTAAGVLSSTFVQPLANLASEVGVYWACGNGATGLHWTPVSVIKWGYSDATTSNLNLWVR